MQIAQARIQTNFGKAAASYDARAGFQHAETRRVLDAALMLLPPAATIGDIGCGTGYFAHAAREQRPDWNILGLDIALGMCDVARSRCTAITGDASQLPFATDSLDAAVSSLCYQWVDNQHAAFAELARTVKPGGRIIVASLGETSLQELRASADAVALPLSMLPMRNFAETVQALEATGLEVTFKEQRVITEYYTDVAALIESMRAIGAGNNFTGARSVTGPKRWMGMVKHYENLRTAHGVPATWEHHFFILRKPL